MAEQNDYKALEIRQESEEIYTSHIVKKTFHPAQEGNVWIKTAYSSVNYKDALSANGNKGVTRNYPHIPGIDAAGTIVESTVPEWKIGDQVIATGFDLGMNTDGGFAEFVEIPAKWLVRLPNSMTSQEAMIYGTAGFTAGISIAALLQNGVKPEGGLIAVSGATGGVGSIAVAILSHLGYKVSAISSKNEASSFLEKLGVHDIISRKDFMEANEKPLLKPKFAAAVDTVGGDLLDTLLKTVQYAGTVTTCGMVGGIGLNTTVLPFILRGIQLVGIDSVEMPLAERLPIWKYLGSDWKPAVLTTLAHEIQLEELPSYLDKIYHSQMKGRAIVKF